MAPLEITITFDASGRQLIERLIIRMDVLITLLLREHDDGTQKQDSDVPGGPGQRD